MDKFKIVTPCHFGVESVLKREITDLGYDIVQVEDGRVTFEGDALAVCRANVFLRTAERVMIQVGRVKATTYDQLFEAVKALDVEKLKMEYHESWFAEDGAEYPIRVFFYKDEAIIALDTSGESLHKRGYRKNTSKAPISETLAAALIMLTPWNKDRILVDPFCGCGTFPIEAAMIAANIAPGMNREFTAENWTNFIDKKLWYKAVNEAYDIMNEDVDTDIQGYDIDPEMVEFAKKNAQLAGVDHLIHFQARPVSKLSHSKKYGFIITNPPYGERLEEKKALVPLYTEIGKRYKALDSWSAFIITSYEDAEKDMGIKATKNRKIYNGMIKTYFYQFMGPKPPKKGKVNEK